MKYVIDDIIKMNQYIKNKKKMFNIEIGEIIKNNRIKNNISMDEFSERSTINSSYLYQIEKGINGITLNNFLIICNSLILNPNDLLEPFLYTSEISNDVLYYELQKNKNISKNILNFMKNK